MKVSPKKYAHALAEALTPIKDQEQQVQQYIKNFLALLQKNRQLKQLPKIFEAFEREWAARNGTLKIKVWYPSAFKDSLVQLENNLSTSLAKKINLQAIPADSLIGGFRLMHDDTLIDASVSGQLEALKEHMTHN